MNTKTIFVLTSKGKDEVEHKTSLLFGDMKRALSMIDGNASFGDLSKRAAPSLRTVLSELFQELNTSGFIEDKAKVGLGAKIKVPTSTTATQSAASELDFTSIMRAPSAQDLAAEAAKIQAVKEQADALGLKAQQDIAKQVRDVKERAENELRAKEHEARSKAVAEAQARAEQEAAKQAAERAHAEQRAKEQAEAARVKAEQEAKQQAERATRLKQEAEVARLKVEQEVKQRLEAEARAKLEAEAAKLKAEQELVKVRQEAELAKQKAEIARLQAEQEAKQRQEAEVRAKQEAEAARLKLEQEAKQRQEAEVRAKQEAEALRLKLEQEAKLRAELAAREQRKIEELKLKAEQELLEAKRQADLLRLQAEQEAIRLKLQVEEQAQAAQAAARQAQLEAEQARVHAEQAAAQARAELAEAQRKAEQESQARLAAEDARQTAELQAQQAREAALLLSQQEQLVLNEIAAQQAAKAREEEEKRAKQHALSAMSTQVRNTPFDTSKPPESAIKLAAIDLTSFAAKPAAEAEAVKMVQQSVEQDKQAARAAETLELQQQEKQRIEQQRTQQVEADKLAAQQLAQSKREEAAESKKLADAQAKAWADAEQKAVASAQSQVNVAVNASPNTERRNAPRVAETLRAKRKPLPWAGIVATLLVLLGLAAWLVPQLMPMQAYAPKIEVQLSAALQQPVHVGTVSARLLPSPRLTLSEVYIGEMKQVKAQKVQLNFGFASLLSDTKRIDSVELQEAELNVSGVLEVANWFEKLASGTQHPISTISFERAKLSAPAVQFDDLTGEMKFSATGKFAAANVRANGGKYVLQVVQGSDSKLDTTLNVHGSALPLLPSWEFADLTAKGELSRSGFVVNDFDGRIAGGSVQGTAKLDWSAGWNMQGTLTGKTMTLVSFSKLLEGDMDGTARFKLQAATLDKLADSAQLEGSFAAKKGVISGADIVETARLRSKENLPGGRTHFDDMSGNLNYFNNVYHFKQIKIKSGVLTANGAVDISNRQMTGRVGASLSIQEGVGAVELQLSGNIDTPNLRAGR